MHVCMYACMHVYMYACIHTYMHTCIHACMHACIHVCCLKQILTEAFKDVFRGIRKVQRAPIKTSTSSCVSFKGCFCASGLCLHKVCSRTLLFHIFSNNNKKIWFGIRRTNKSNSLIRGFCYSVNKFYVFCSCVFVVLFPINLMGMIYRGARNQEQAPHNDSQL